MLTTCLLVLCLSAGAAAPAPQPKENTDRPEASSNGVPAADMSRYTVEPVITGLEVPWSIVWTSPARMLISERPGRIRVATLQQGEWKLQNKPLHEFKDVRRTRGGEIGLMGLCVHPQYDQNKFVYAAFGSTDDDVRIVRFVDAGDALTEPKVIIDKIPAAPNHAGCRPAFGPDGKLYITTGDTYRRELAQDLSSLAGKTLRLNDDGSVPDDNPFVGREGARPEIFSYGHRNAQGLDWQPESGLMFQSEHGPSGGDGPQGYDEVNIVEKGHNLGWPEAFGERRVEGADAPIVFWKNATAPASGCFYDRELIADLKGCFLVGCLGGLRASPEPGIYVIRLDGRKVTGQEHLATTYGRIREVAVGPDGAVYFSTSNRDGRGGRMKQSDDDKIMRIRPKS